jgi:MFS family permease
LSATPGPRGSLRVPIFYGWVVVAVAFVTMSVGVNARTAFSLLYPPILDEFGWDRATTAAAFSIGFIASTLYSPFVGVVMDRLGPRYVLPIAAVTVSAGMILATWVSQPWHLYLTLGVLVGTSVMLTYIGHSMFLPNWFVRRRGLAIGIAFSGVGVGSILLLPWLQRLIDGQGWRAACWALAALLLVVVLPLNFFFQRQRPEELGLAPDGEGGAGAAPGTPAALDHVVDEQWAKTEWTLASAMRTTRFWWLFVGFVSGLFVWYAVQVHQTKYLREIGFSAESAAYALGLVALIGIAGQILLGHLSDRIGREWVWTVAFVGFGLCYLLLLAMRQYPWPALMYLMVAAQGFLGYGVTAVYAAIPFELFQGKRYGTIFGMLSLASGLGAAAGPWVTGVLYDRTGSYVLAFWLAIGLCLVSSVCIWFAAPRKVRAVTGQIARLRAAGVIRSGQDSHLAFPRRMS